VGHPIDKNPRAYPNVVQGHLLDGRSYLLRSLVPNEIDNFYQLVEIYRDVYRELGEEWSKENAANLLRDLFRHNSIQRVAFIEGEMVGAICLGTKYNFHGRAVVGKEFFVRQPDQGSGIGTRMFETALDQARVYYPDVETMELATFADTGHARDFYEKLGFKGDPRLIFMEGDIHGVRKRLSERVGGENRI